MFRVCTVFCFFLVFRKRLLLFRKDTLKRIVIIDCEGKNIIQSTPPPDGLLLFTISPQTKLLYSALLVSQKS